MEKIKSYTDKSCFYILKVDDNVYRFGITNQVETRFKTHLRNFKHIDVVFLKDVHTKRYTSQVENKFRRYAKLSGCETHYNTEKKIYYLTINQKEKRSNAKYSNHIDFLQPTKDFPISHFINEANNIIDEVTKNIKDKKVIVDYVSETTEYNLMNSLSKLLIADKNLDKEELKRSHKLLNNFIENKMEKK